MLFWAVDGASLGQGGGGVDSGGSLQAHVLTALGGVSNFVGE